MGVKNEGQKSVWSNVKEHKSYIYQMCKRAPLPIYMRNENVIDKQALEWCSLM